ncbi:hypothetical protein KKA14_20320, partial [bacterium]|nr:hypothetical protein [bacterium]
TQSIKRSKKSLFSNARISFFAFINILSPMPDHFWNIGNAGGIESNDFLPVFTIHRFKRAVKNLIHSIWLFFFIISV